MDNQRDQQQISTSGTPKAKPEVEQAAADDAAGFAMGAPPASMWQIAPKLALLRTLPDPGPEDWVQHVQSRNLGQR